MSGEESNPVINELKREISFLKTDLTRYKLLSNCFQKYYDFNEINETIDTNEELLDLKDNIKSLKEGHKQCFISVEKLNGNQFNEISVKRGKRRRSSEDNELIELDKVLHTLQDKFKNCVGDEKDYHEIESLLKEYETQTSTKRFKFQNVATSNTLNKTSLLILEVIAFFQELQQTEPNIKEIFKFFQMHINDLERKCNDYILLSLYDPKTHKKDKLSEFVHVTIEDKLVPIHIKGDGNCLWNSVSVSLFGNYKMMESLRVLTAATLLKHNQQLSEYISTFYGNNHETSFDRLVSDATELKVWGNELHIMILSMALKRPIYLYGSLKNFPKSCAYEHLKSFYESKHILYHSRYVADPSFHRKEPILLYYNGADHYSVVLRTGPTIIPFVPKAQILLPQISIADNFDTSLQEQETLTQILQQTSLYSSEESAPGSSNLSLERNEQVTLEADHLKEKNSKIKVLESKLKNSDNDMDNLKKKLSLLEKENSQMKLDKQNLMEEIQLIKTKTFEAVCEICQTSLYINNLM